MVNCVPKMACSDCPYRKTAPLRKWSVSHFIDVIKSEMTPYGLGAVFMCHKHPDKTKYCGGWLLSQKERQIPSVTLKMFRVKWSEQDMKNFKFLKKPHNSEMFYDPIEMALENYPEISGVIKLLKLNSENEDTI